MIQKKQALTEEILLSFKKDHGEFYQKFVNSLKGKVHYYRRVKEDVTCPQYMTAQKCIFSCILERKHKKFQDEEFNIVEFAQILQKYRSKIQKSISGQKQCILNRSKTTLEEIQNTVLEIITRQSFSFNAYGLIQNTYVYELIKAVTGKKQEVNVFGDVKYSPFTYTQKFIDHINDVFGQKVMFIDYNASKSFPQNIKFNFDRTYILRIKDRYSILYVKEPKDITIIKEDVISLTDVEKIFMKIEPKNEQGFFDKVFKGEEKIEKSSKLFPDQIACSKCLGMISEFDCLKWNYQFYCCSCLQNPRLDTSNIPPSLVQKYFQEKGIKHSEFQIACAQCTALTSIKKYNPAYKPTKYTCSVCEHKICLQHDQDIYKCFCECINCKEPTIALTGLKIVTCQKCKRKYCRNCNKLGTKICDCICMKCLQLKEDNHLCKERCHFCHNHINRLKDCVCGSKLCYGCYYYKLNQAKQQGKIVCNAPSSYA